VSPRNERALHLYERNGYRLRHSIAFWSLARA
jgi:RimJ/RimL family protein N-acetyltransferase